MFNGKQIQEILKKFEAEDYELIIFRIWSVAIGFFIPVFALFNFYLLKDVYQPLDTPFSMTLIYSIIIILSYFYEICRKYIPILVLIADLSATAFITYVSAHNNFSIEYSIGLFLAFCCLVSFRRNVIEMIVYYIGIAIILAIAFLLTPKMEVNVYIYSLSFFIMTIIGYLTYKRREFINNKLKVLNTKLEENNIELEEKNIELERFAYIASHDLKEPLRNITSFTGLLKRKIQSHLDEDTRTYFDFIVRSTKQMNELIASVLEYSKSQKAHIQLENIDTTPILNNNFDNHNNQTIMSRHLSVWAYLFCLNI